MATIDVKLDARYIAEVDEYGKQDQLEKQAAKKKKTSKNLLGTFINDEADTSFRFEGNEYNILVTAPRKETEVVDKELLYKMLKKTKFLELAKFSLEDLRAWLQPDQLEKVIKKTSGPRMWKAQPKCCGDE